MWLMLNTTDEGITENSCTLPETPSVCLSWGKSSFQTTPAMCSCTYNDAEPGWQGHRKTKNTKLTHTQPLNRPGRLDQPTTLGPTQTLVLDFLADTNEQLLLAVTKAIHGTYPRLSWLSWLFLIYILFCVYVCKILARWFVPERCVCRCVCISTGEESWEVVCFWS